MARQVTKSEADLPILLPTIYIYIYLYQPLVLCLVYCHPPRMARKVYQKSMVYCYWFRVAERKESYKHPEWESVQLKAAWEGENLGP